ncbi:MAG: glycoside hydrolase family 9 protein, partial [Gorillibacterium sp.]|nr:glycoside hydrolase family 9 protein [Gorillibacterium sp.]
MHAATGLLVSQIGYDRKDPMRALIRSPRREELPTDVNYQLIDALTGEVVMTGPVTYWGTLWQHYWWEADFSNPGISEAKYRLEIGSNNEVFFASAPFPISDHLLWKEAFIPVALEQMEERSKRARNGNGWKDCGSEWREANSHATAVIGLCDILTLGFEWLSSEEIDRLAKQLTVGCDYLALCQDQAQALGIDRGAVVHEIPNHLFVIPGDVMQCVVAFSYASRLLIEHAPDKSKEYLERAKLSFDYLQGSAAPYGPVGFSALNHGAPEDYKLPQDWMTRDLLMMLWGSVELWVSGADSRYKDHAVQTARRIMKRQVPEDQAEDGCYGHFYTFDDGGFTEKANIHHHVGHDTGGTFPQYIIPFLDMASRWYDHPDAPLWRECVQRFAYGYFLPACKRNPFYLLPTGVFGQEGLLVFSGPWHGINVSYGWAASLALKLEIFTDDSSFRQIAVGNVQWIAGLNAGVTSDSFGSCLAWKEAIPEGAAVPYSLIYGIGSNHAKT